MSHSPSIPSNPHALPLVELEAALQTDLQQGLSPAERARRLEHYGPNQLQLAEPISAWRILL